MPLYTPFVERNVDKMIASSQDRQRKELTQSAYMGDPNAMGQLAQVDPQAADRIRRSKLQDRQLQLSQQKQKLQQKKYEREEIELIAENASKLPFEQAAAYADKAARDLGVDPPPLTEELHQQMKARFGGEFSGSGMEAQVSNILTKGVDSEEFRETPEYARAYQLANKPQVIRTPTGDIIMRPELPSVFKPPGDTRTVKKQVGDIKAAVKEDVERVKGTEKEIKTTADEKLSFGFYSRMVASEDNIKGLGDFDSSGTWERLKGLTNIGASPELQQYRQAAGDWIRSKLRRESGAAIAPGEMEAEYQIYFPQIGDGQAVIDQKKKSRSIAQESMKVAAGKEYKKQNPKTEVPVVGDNVDVYTYMGGDPAQPESWSKN